MLQTADRRLNRAAGKMKERRTSQGGGRGEDGTGGKGKGRKEESGEDTGEAKWFKVGGHIPSRTGAIGLSLRSVVPDTTRADGQVARV